MKIYVCIFLVFIILILLLININKNNNKNNIYIILYYTDWCGYSKLFIKNIWSKLKLRYRENNIINLISIDCDKNKQQCKLIEGYPTLYLKKNNKMIEYTDKRTIQNIVKFIDSYQDF